MAMTKRTLIAGTVATVATGAAVTQAAAGQTNMTDAIKRLRQAKRSLEDAASNKGGHRVKAIKLIEEAIAEVNLGIQHAQRS